MLHTGRASSWALVSIDHVVSRRITISSRRSQWKLATRFTCYFRLSFTSSTICVAAFYLSKHLSTVLTSLPHYYIRTIVIARPYNNYLRYSTEQHLIVRIAYCFYILYLRIILRTMSLCCYNNSSLAVDIKRFQSFSNTN